jgi:hypothetical protein
LRHAADPKLIGLLQIAEVLADRACMELSAATKACSDLEAELQKLKDAHASTLAAPVDPANGAILANLQKHQSLRRIALMQKLAAKQAVRLEKLRLAQQAEGRRQALQELISHAS